MRTADGHRLRLTRPLIEEILDQGASVRGVTDGLSRLAAKTRRVAGPSRRPGARRVLFAGRSGATGVKLLGRPLRPGVVAVVALRLRPAPDTELEVPRAVAAQIRWNKISHKFRRDSRSGRVTLSGRLRRTSGVYIVYRNRRPLYVGQTGNLRRRWLEQRLAVFRELNLPDVGGTWPEYEVYVGTVSRYRSAPAPPNQTDRKMREAVERVLVRHLIEDKGQTQLTNANFVRNPFTVDVPGLTVINGRSPSWIRPPFLDQKITRAAGVTFELRHLYT